MKRSDIISNINQICAIYTKHYPNGPTSPLDSSIDSHRVWMHCAAGGGNSNNFVILCPVKDEVLINWLVKDLELPKVITDGMTFISLLRRLENDEPVELGTESIWGGHIRGICVAPMAIQVSVPTMQIRTPVELPLTGNVVDMLHKMCFYILDMKLSNQAMDLDDPTVELSRAERYLLRTQMPELVLLSNSLHGDKSEAFALANKKGSFTSNNMHVNTFLCNLVNAEVPPAAMMTFTF